MYLQMIYPRTKFQSKHQTSSRLTITTIDMLQETLWTERNDVLRTKTIGPSSPEKSAWWKVDLGGVYNIYSVNIFFLNYEGYGISIFISYDKHISLQK